MDLMIIILKMEGFLCLWLSYKVGIKLIIFFNLDYFVWWMFYGSIKDFFWWGRCDFW